MQRSRRHLRSPDRRWRHQIAASLCWKEIATPLRGSQRRIATALPDLGMTIGNRSFVGAVTRLRNARLRIFLWEQAYKPGSVTGPLTLPSPPSRGGEEYEKLPDGDHLSGTPVTRRLMQPTRGCGGPPHLPPCGLAPGGVCSGLRSPGASCALTARLHPYPEPLATLGYRATPCT